MAVKPEIRVEGLKELRKALRGIDQAAPRELRVANKRAAEIVAARARERGQQSRPNVAGRPTRLGSRGVASIKVQASQTSAAVVMGGPSVPYAVGHEWGAKRYRQFPLSSKEGYILRPSLEEKQREIVEAYNQLVGELIARYFGEAS